MKFCYNFMISPAQKFNMNLDTQEPITVLGKTFNSELERSTFFREELRKKLPELKKMEGFPIGEDEDILNLSDPPYYTACPNPWLNDFISEWEGEKKELEKKGKRETDFEVEEPFASDVSEGKNNPVYMAHSYHTKVPHPAIMKYLLHYTQPGDIVYDGFAGTGMTGVAASMCSNIKEFDIINKEDVKEGKRQAICNDLSPIASFIAYSYNSADSFDRLDRILDSLEKLKTTLNWVYKTKHGNTNQFGEIINVIWSELYSCPNCNFEFSFWDVAVDIEANEIKENFSCPNCGSLHTKSKLSPVLETIYLPENEIPQKHIKLVPALITYNFQGKRFQKFPDEEDNAIIENLNNKKLVNVNFDKVYQGDEIGRLSKHGINNIREIYFRRSRYLLELIQEELGIDITFLLTSVSQNSSMLYRFRLNGKGGTTSGTYYICATPQENNVFNSLASKVRDIKKALILIDQNQVVSTSSSSISKINDSSIDYIFTDPPFGSNLMYSELNLIMETWLKVYTNNKDEAITNKAQNKKLYDYQYIMSACFKDNYRILKPGKWMTVEFSNTSASVWNTIQTSLQNSGFIIANVASLDKKQGSFKAVNTVTAVKQDLVISCYKPSSKFDQKFRQHQNTDVAVWDFVEEHLQHLPVHLIVGNSTTAIVERSPKILFDRLISFYVQKGFPVPIDARKFQQGLKERFIERDGMFFTNNQVQEYDKKKAAVPNFTQLSIFVANEQDSIYWLRNILEKGSKTEQDLHPYWMKEVAGNMRKGDTLPEMRTILEENFLKDANGKWFVPDPENEADLEKLRNKRLLKQFETYIVEVSKPKGKIIEVRVEALRAGFKQCYQDKDFKTIVTIGDRIPNDLLMLDEVLLQFYDIASSKV